MTTQPIGSQRSHNLLKRLASNRFKTLARAEVKLLRKAAMGCTTICSPNDIDDDQRNHTSKGEQPSGLLMEPILVTVMLLFCIGTGHAQPSLKLHPKSNTERAVALLIQSGKTDIMLIQHNRKTDSIPPNRLILSGSFIGELMLLRADAVPGRLLRFFGFSIDGDLSMTPDHDAVPFSVSFINCEFTSHISFAGEFDKNVEFSYVTFDKGLSLDNVHIKGNLTFSDVSKSPTASFVNITMRSAIVDGDVTFDNLDTPAPDSIDGTGLTTTTLFFFPAPLTVRSVDFSSLRANDATFACDHKCVPLDYLKIEDAIIKDHLRLSDFGTKNLHAQGLSVGVQTTIDGTTPIEATIDLSQAALGSFHWEIADAKPSNDQGKHKHAQTPQLWPSNILINGISFSNLSVIPEQHVGKDKAPSPANAQLSEKLALTLQFLKNADFFQPAFFAYQKSLEAAGLDAAANDVNAAMHAKLRHNMLHEWSGVPGFLGAIFAVLVDLVQSLFFGYGRSAFPPLLWSVGFITTGALIFKRERDMEAPKKDEAPAYSGFWYSLEMFLPFVDLGVAKGWRPKKVPKWRLWYARIHQLAGWILIPVAIGALTGSFK